jgi:hypothetical protein
MTLSITTPSRITHGTASNRMTLSITAISIAKNALDTQNDIMLKAVFAENQNQGYDAENYYG